jgi:hypothetical protein
MMYTGRLLTLGRALGAEIAESGGCRDLVPVELAVEALPGAIIEKMDAPLPNREGVLLLASNLAALAAGAEFIIN